MTSHPSTADADACASSDSGDAAIGAYVDAARVAVDVEASSRKRLFERMAQLIATRNDALDVDAVLGVLTRREKLGSTALGDGIALPHARIDGIGEPQIAVVRLKHAVEYEAADGKPVWLAACLLVPTEANQTHLRLLAALAERFNNAAFIARVKDAANAAQLAAQFARAP